MSWLVSETSKQLQRFLRFGNVYQRFIHNYNSITALLTYLMASKIPFLWSQSANAVFQAFSFSSLVQTLSDSTLWKWMPRMSG